VKDIAELSRSGGVQAGIIVTVCKDGIRHLWWAIAVALLALPLAACQENNEAAPIGATIRVTSIGDTNKRDGVVTLREAILLATGGLAPEILDPGEAGNVSGSPGASSADVVTLDKPIFPLSQPATVALASPLPPLNGGRDVVDATGAGVILSGGSKTLDCLVITSSENVVRGFQVRECQIGILLEEGAAGNTIGGSEEGQGNVLAANQTGVRIATGAEGNVVEGNRIGANRPGATGDANELGVFVAGRANVIGGRNVISGNERVGITVGGAGNVLRGNFIGTDPTGTIAVPNGVEGVWLAGEGNTVGGNTAADRNVISGNGLFGINVSGSGAKGNVLKGNYVGLDATGQKTLGNDNGVGVSFGAQNNVIGGTASGEANVISGNRVGVLIRDEGTTGNTLRGNRIGTDGAGEQPVANSTGILILGGARGNAIGGPAKGEGNVISANAVGVVVEGTSTGGNPIRGNSVFANAGAGIEVRDEANDGVGPPVVTGVGPVRGSACAGCTVDIYSDDEDEGRTYEGSAVALSDGTFEADVNPDGPAVTATATDVNGSTSAYSQPFAITR
jgi:titin